MSMLQAIQERLAQLPPQEGRLADFVLRQPRETVQMTITELARQSGSSTATISRFCRSMQADNFAEFKLKLAMELAEQADRPPQSQYQDIVAGQPLDQMIEALTANHIRSVSDTTRLVDLGRLKTAIDALHGARRIDLYGSATSGLVAQDLQQKLVRIGKAAIAFSDPHMQQTSAASLTDRDVAVGFSYSGETPETIEALRCAAEQGAMTISVTRYGACTLADAAAVSLFTSSSEAGMRRGDMASRMAQLHLVDMLFVGLASEYFDVYVPRLEQSYHTVRRYTGRKGRKHDESADI